MESVDKVNKTIDEINSLVKEGDKEEELNKISRTFCQQVEDLVHLETPKQIESLYELFNLSEEYFNNYGDDLIEKAWFLYDENNFYIDVESSNEFFFNLFFITEKSAKQAKEVFSIESNGEILSKPIETIREHIKKLNLSCLTPGEQKNCIIDYLVMAAYSKSDIKSFYTSLSSFLIQTKSSVLLLFKSLSLFGLFFQQQEKKENFLDGLLFIIGGVLRDYARSYLKTKGILKENISYTACNKHHVSYFNTRNMTRISLILRFLHLKNVNIWRAISSSL
jgi:hypothetical protein